MKVKSILAVILLGGCVTTQEDRMCLDWGSFPIMEEKCQPLYGNVICTTEERTRYWCKLYEEKDE